MHSSRRRGKNSKSEGEKKKKQKLWRCFHFCFTQNGELRSVVEKSGQSDSLFFSSGEIVIPLSNLIEAALIVLNEVAELDDLEELF